MKVRKWLSVSLALLLLLSLTACGGSSSADAEMDYAEAPMQMVNGSFSSDSAASRSESPAASLPENRKLIRTVRIDAETEALDELLVTLDEKISSLGGYVEDREVFNGSSYSQRRYRSASLTIRIPADQVDGFVTHVSGVSNIVSSNETVEDVTLQYVDTESRVKALETEQTRLLELLEQAQSLADILEIESRLTDVRYELESYASRLRTYDNLISYATVHLSISEVQEYTPVEEETLWQRISGGFVGSLKGIAEDALELMVFLIVSSPYLVVYGAIALAIVVIVRKSSKKRKAKKTPPPEKSE